MQRGKISFFLLVVLVALFGGGGDALAEPNSVDIWHYSPSLDRGEAVDIVENENSSSYLESMINPNLRFWGIGSRPGNPNDGKLSWVGINSDGRNVARLAFSVDQDISDGTDRVIIIYYMGSIGEYGYGPLNYQKKNIFMIQDPNDPNDNTPDPNKYDVLTLTNYFNQEGTINLPPVTSSTPRDQVSANWYFITSNYADIYPQITDGIVNFNDFAHFSLSWLRNDCDPNNHWCNFSDLDRSGVVDSNDLGLFSNEWLWDANDPNTW